MNDNQIEQTSADDNKAESGHGKTKVNSLQVYRPRKWLALVVTGGLAIGGVAGFGWLYWTSLTFSDVVDGLKFFTEGSIALGLLIVAVVQACVYWSQRRIMSAQWNAMERGLELTDKMIDKIGRQAETMDRSLVISTRAYVGVHSIILTREEPYALLVKIENIGHVPAEDIELVMELIVIMPKEWVERSPSVREYSRYKFQETYGRSKLFRGNLQIVTATSLSTYLSKEEIPLVMQERGRGILGLGGYVDYLDGFNPERQRTEFHFMYDPHEDAWFTESPDLLDQEASGKDKKGQNPN